VEKEAFYREALGSHPGPLSGLRVLDVTTAWAGPMAACVLADLGCDVIHLDLPGSPGGSNFTPNLPGTELSSAHQTVNRNKRSVTIDLRRPEGVELALELVTGVDILVENFRPGTLEQWGLGYEHCRAARPDLIYLSLSGYGQFGPWSSRPGYDPAALATSGWMSLNGSPDGPPTKAPTYLADDLAGLHGAIGVLAALHHRAVSGEGQHVDVALLDAILFQSIGFPTLAAMGASLSRMGNQVLPTAPTNAFECADGRHVYLAIALDSHWRSLAVAMGRPDLAKEPGMATNAARLQNRDACDRLVADWCRSIPSSEVIHAAVAAGIVAAPVNTYHEAVAEQHVRERDMLVPVELSDGSVAPITGPAAKFSRTPTTVRVAAPAIGAHTEEVLRGIGIADDRLDKLRELGVI
jgi:formyl-CoA transferase